MGHAACTRALLIHEPSPPRPAPEDAAPPPLITYWKISNPSSKWIFHKTYCFSSVGGVELKTNFFIARWNLCAIFLSLNLLCPQVTAKTMWRCVSSIGCRSCLAPSASAAGFPHRALWRRQPANTHVHDQRTQAMKRVVSTLSMWLENYCSWEEGAGATYKQHHGRWRLTNWAHLSYEI
jgi:hypothetical protein